MDRTWTNAITTGASLQGINDDKIFGHDNYFTIGGSVDRSKIGFQGNSELGYIYPDFFVGPNAAVPGTGQIVRTAGNIGFAPVSLAAWNTYYGIYVNDTFDITNRLSVTAGGRYNIAQISMADLLGTSPDLSAQYTFERFNPVVGFTYKILPELMTFYAGYSEANRAPTPLELGCSNPLRPCLLEGFLVSDPPLNQVVARTKEVGLRGNFNNAGGRGDWKLGLFRTDSESDIIQVASVLQGRGVFQNVPATRRQGLETASITRPNDISYMPTTPWWMRRISSRACWRRRTIRRQTPTETSWLRPASRFQVFRSTRSRAASITGSRPC